MVAWMHVHGQMRLTDPWSTKTPNHFPPRKGGLEPQICALVQKAQQSSPFPCPPFVLASVKEAGNSLYLQEDAYFSQLSRSCRSSWWRRGTRPSFSLLHVGPAWQLKAEGLWVYIPGPGAFPGALKCLSDFRGSSLSPMYSMQKSESLLQVHDLYATN